MVLVVGVNLLVPFALKELRDLFFETKKSHILKTKTKNKQKTHMRQKVKQNEKVCDKGVYFFFLEQVVFAMWI